MGLLSEILKLPFAPIRGLIAIGEIVQEQVEMELQHPASVRRDLEETERARAEGRISAEEQQKAEQEIIDRLIE